MNTTSHCKVQLCPYDSKDKDLVAPRDLDQESYVDLGLKGCLLGMCNDYISVASQYMCGTWGL